MSNIPPNGKHILVVDDEPLVRGSLTELLTLSGYTVSSAENGKEAVDFLNQYTTDIVISDIKMPQLGGIELLRHIKDKHPLTPVILITGYGSIESAVEAMREGAYDYVTKPIIDTEIKIIIERLISQRQLQEENKNLKEQLSLTQQRDSFCGIVGKDVKMQKIYTLIEAISNTRATVLIHGESGTGKRLIAHAIHNCNKYEQGKPFVEVSCGALTETLLESELFGHVKGAFTGAIKDRVGRFELADGGTIFLDEIDAFSPTLQVKLLRVLQEGEFERVGDTRTIRADIRVIAATNQDLEDLIVNGKFRKDLYYRLNIISIEIPPLRDRNQDIPFLVQHFIQKYAKNLNKKISSVSDEALEALMRYNWPGNIRELENMIERAMILTRANTIGLEDFPETLSRVAKKPTVVTDDGMKLKEAMKSPEKDLILKVLNSVNWKRNEAAKLLGINRTTLYKKMLNYGLLKDKGQHAARQ